MRLISADALMQKFAEFVRRSNDSDFTDIPTWNDAVSLVDSAPTIDAVEVVRCKDCKHRVYTTDWFSSYWSCGFEDVNGDPYVHTRDAENDMYYCADAERKEDE